MELMDGMENPKLWISIKNILRKVFSEYSTKEDFQLSEIYYENITDVNMYHTKENILQRYK